MAFDLASFRFDVTPPVGHGCCGGWITPVEHVDDNLEAIGVLLLPPAGSGEKPVILCTLDWTGLANAAHAEMRGVMAAAAGTTSDRVSIHVLHPHNAPMACSTTERSLLANTGGAALSYGEHPLDLDFFEGCKTKAAAAVAAALAQAAAVTHVGTGKAAVEEVASNRRIDIGADGKIGAARSSSCADPAIRALPLGLIDPFLRTVSFFGGGGGGTKLASLHYYACHPMSYYGDGRVTVDFAGLARKRRQAEEPGVAHLYFSGCGGNLGAGKYNDGTPPMRPVLTDR